MNLRKPTRKHVKALVEWMESPDRGDVLLTGPDRHIWSKPDMDDLAIMNPDEFSTSRFIPTLVYWYHEALGRYIHVRTS